MGIIEKFAFARRGVTVLLLSSAMVLQACDEQIALAPGAVSEDAACGQYRSAIAAARRTEIDQQVQTAVAGAVIGAIGGLLVGGSSGERARNAIIGAAIGGLTGYSASYLQQKAQRSNDSNTILASVNQDAGNELRLVSSTGRAVQSLRNCRRAEIAALSNSVKAGRTPPSTARSQLSQISAKVNQDNQLISQAFNGIGQRVNAYSGAQGAIANADANITQANARARAPQVQQVARAQNAQVAQDTRAQAALAADLEALDVLLG